MTAEQTSGDRIVELEARIATTERHLTEPLRRRRELEARVAELEADLALNAGMLARQTDLAREAEGRVAELERALGKTFPREAPVDSLGSPSIRGQTLFCDHCGAVYEDGCGLSALDWHKDDCSWRIARAILAGATPEPNHDEPIPAPPRKHGTIQVKPVYKGRAKLPVMEQDESRRAAEEEHQRALLERFDKSHQSAAEKESKRTAAIVKAADNYREAKRLYQKTLAVGPQCEMNQALHLLEVEAVRGEEQNDGD